MEIQKRDAVMRYINRNEFKDFIQLVKQMTTTDHDQQQLHPSAHARDDEQEDTTMSQKGLVLGPTNIREDFEATVRSSYDSYLNLQGRTLSWVMVVDGIFLLDVVKDYYDQMNNTGSIDPLTERYVQEILMLENQIPLEVLQQIKKALKRSFAGATDIDLYDKFNYLCVQNSPLKLSKVPEVKKEALEKHILHQMYWLILENNVDATSSGTSTPTTRAGASGHEGPVQEIVASVERGPPEKGSCCCSIFAGLAEWTTSKVTSLSEWVEELVSSSEVNDIVRQVGNSVDAGFQQTRLSGVKIPSNVEMASKILHELAKNSNLFLQSSSNPKRQKGLVTEIHVPTVYKLHKIAKMEFVPTEGGLQSLFMDWHNNELHLPVITLKANSEVVLRNLVAYELANLNGGTERFTMELTEYVDLMCGLIDTENDVKLLKKRGIIVGNLGEDEILAIFNGIDKSMEWLDKKSSKVQNFVIDVNRKFDNICIVKAFRSFMKFLARSQDVIMKIFPLLVLILLTLQYICDIRGCSGSRGLRGYVAASWDYSNSSPGAGSSMASADSQPNVLMMPRKLLRYSSP